MSLYTKYHIHILNIVGSRHCEWLELHLLLRHGLRRSIPSFRGNPKNILTAP